MERCLFEACVKNGGGMWLCGVLSFRSEDMGLWEVCTAADDGMQGEWRDGEERQGGTFRNGGG